jgi:hypothetical protein
MFGSNVFDIAIGLVFVFLLLRLVCSAANELLELVLKKRAGDLERGIAELLGTKVKGSQFLKDIYDHGLINSLYRGDYSTTWWWKLPAYIPARNFALAIQDVYTAWTAARKAAPDGVAPGATDPTKASLPAIPVNVHSAIKALTQEAAGDAKKLQDGIENWYNSSMDRVSGWYKRRSQMFIFVMGATVAIAVNADCIEIAKRLSNDASLRQSVVAMAEAAAKKDPTKGDSTKPLDDIKDNIKTLDGLGLPIGWPPPDADPITHIVPSLSDRFTYAFSQHWLGWLLTALAVSLGAPFWFDMLNKIIVVRSTVKPHEKSKEESSKDART